MNKFSDFHSDSTLPAPIEYLVGPIEAAKFLHVDLDTIFYWAMVELVPAHQLRYEGKTAWRFRLSELALWREQNPDLAGPKGRKRVSTRKRTGQVTRKRPTSARPNSSLKRNIS